MATIRAVAILLGATCAAGLVAPRSTCTTRLRSSSNPDFLEEVWENAVKLAMNHVPNRIQDVVATVSKRLIEIRRFAQAAELHEGIDQHREALVVGNRFDQLQLELGAINVHLDDDEVVRCRHRPERSPRIARAAPTVRHWHIVEVEPWPSGLRHQAVPTAHIVRRGLPCPDPIKGDAAACVQPLEERQRGAVAAADRELTRVTPRRAAQIKKQVAPMAPPEARPSTGSPSRYR